ncbi:hypothetical protein, partial [Streptomyces sp. NPDC005209]|uniref:hypothetical protein n=1 Tax=Streptomyces sp. NPDC005209 TaxID=3156715 RepID=UPI0033BCF5AF
MVLTATVLVVALRAGDLNDTSKLTAVLSFGLSVAGLAIDLLRGGSSTSEPGTVALSQERLVQLAERLAAAVQEQWEEEWRLRR